MQGKLLRILLPALLLFTAATTVSPPLILAQAPASTNSMATDRERGLRLLDNGQTKEAIDMLRAAVKQDKTDEQAWCYLGVALLRTDEIKAARKSFETALKLNSQIAMAHTGLAYALAAMTKDNEAAREANAALQLKQIDPVAHYILGLVKMRALKNQQAITEAETAIAQDPNYAPAYLLKSQILLALQGDESIDGGRILQVPGSSDPEKQAERARETQNRFRNAVGALETYLKLAPRDNQTQLWAEQLETLKVFARVPNRPDIVSAREVTTKARVLAKPEPTYTTKARNAGIIGTVVLRAVFTAEGKVEHILVLRALPGGLTEQAAAAARKITFVPATKDGKPVSMFMQLEYNFNLY